MIFEDDYGAFLFLLPIFLIIFDTEDLYFLQKQKYAEEHLETDQC